MKQNPMSQGITARETIFLTTHQTITVPIILLILRFQQYGPTLSSAATSLPTMLWTSNGRHLPHLIRSQSIRPNDIVRAQGMTTLLCHINARQCQKKEIEFISQPQKKEYVHQGSMYYWCPTTKSKSSYCQATNYTLSSYNYVRQKIYQQKMLRKTTSHDYYNKDYKCSSE